MIENEKYMAQGAVKATLVSPRELQSRNKIQRVPEAHSHRANQAVANTYHIQPNVCCKYLVLFILKQENMATL